VTSDFRTNSHAYSRRYGVGWLRKPIVAYLRRFHNACAFTMVPTPALLADLQACGFQRLRVVAARSGHLALRPRAARPGRQERGAGPHDTVVLCVGRLAAETWAAAGRGVRGCACRSPRSAARPTLGDGPMREALRRRVPEARFAGMRVGVDSARHWTRRPDLFVLPSLTETFGRGVTLEALASGLPVVAFDSAAASRCVRRGSTAGSRRPTSPAAPCRPCRKPRAWTRRRAARWG
jgi:hypothetical protein